MERLGYPGLMLVFQIMGYQMLRWLRNLMHWLYFTPIYSHARNRFADYFRFEPEKKPTAQGRKLVLKQLKTLAAEVSQCNQDRQNYDKLHGSNYLNRYYEERLIQATKGFDGAFRFANRFGYRFSNTEEYTDFLPKREDPLTLPELFPEFSMVLAN